MVKSKSDTIILRGEPYLREQVCEKAINPGHLLQRTSLGMQPHAIAKGVTPRLFARENVPSNKGINEAYAKGDMCIMALCRGGEEIMARVSASSPSIAIYDLLESDGKGGLQKMTDGYAIAQALEAIDNSAGASEVFIKCEVL